VLDFRHGQGMFLLSAVSRPALGTIKPPIYGYRAFFSGSEAVST
jgi:hypothetical protein